MKFSDFAKEATNKAANLAKEATDLAKEATNKATDLAKEAADKAVDLAKTEMEKNAEKAAELAEAEAQKNAELAQIRANQDKFQNVSFQIDSGYQLIHASPMSTMFQREDMTVFFDTNQQDRFLFIDYSWSGPRFETTTESVSNKTGQEVTKGKSGRMAAGAVLGTFLLPVPGVGTAVGAAVGAGGKKKKNTNSQSDTRSVRRENELLTPATLKFKNMDNGQIVSIVIGCNTLIDSQIKCLQIQHDQSIQETSKDTADIVKELKSLKELLDMGAITQEEFDQKKQQLIHS